MTKALKTPTFSFLKHRCFEHWWSLYLNPKGLVLLFYSNDIVLMFWVLQWIFMIKNNCWGYVQEIMTSNWYIGNIRAGNRLLLSASYTSCSNNHLTFNLRLGWENELVWMGLVMSSSASSCWISLSTYFLAIMLRRWKLCFTQT
jgi:hypothetical protein